MLPFVSRVVIQSSCAAAETRTPFEHRRGVSFRLDARRFDDVGPFYQFGFDEGAQFLD